MSLESAMKAETELSELVRWMKLGSTKPGYGNSPTHVLRCDIGITGTFSYCGQAYAGANNYHDAPAWFKGAVVKALEAYVQKAVKEAYESEVARLREAVQSGLNEAKYLVDSTEGL